MSLHQNDIKTQYNNIKPTLNLINPNNIQFSSIIRIGEPSVNR
jgi:hypothetical protein